MYRFEHQASYNWSSEKWGDERRKWSTILWKEAANSLLIGETERVPYLRHDLFNYEWEAIGKILLKGYIETGYFLVILSKAFVQYTLFREGGADDLLSSLFIYLSNEEVNMLKGLIAEESVADDFSSDEFYDVYEGTVFSNKE